MPRTVLASGLNALHPCLQATCPLSCAACSRPLLPRNSLFPRPSRRCQPLPTSLTISSKSPSLPLNREVPRLCPHPTLSLKTLATPHPTRASAHICAQSHGSSAAWTFAPNVSRVLDSAYVQSWTHHPLITSLSPDQSGWPLDALS